MKLAIALSALSLTTAGIVAGCGGAPAITCQMQACSTGTNTFQVCANTDGTETYDFGGMSCHCGGNTGTNCQTCTTEVAAFCDPNGGIGGTGGTGGGGSGGGGGGGMCKSVFSGGINATYMPCAVTITYVAGTGTTIATAGNAISGTQYTWNGFNMTNAGMPATGTFDQTASEASSDSITQPGSQNPPFWEAGFGSGHVYGTATVTITSLGPSSDVNGTTLYQSPHGTWTATLQDQNQTTHLPDVMQTVTF